MADLWLRHMTEAATMIGAVVCVAGGLAFVALILWASINGLWKAMYQFGFGARVIRKGLKVEAEDQRKASQAAWEKDLV